MKVVGDSRSIAIEIFALVKFFGDNYQKNILLPSVVQFVEWNTKAAIFTKEGFSGFETIVRYLPNLSFLMNIADDN